MSVDRLVDNQRAVRRNCVVVLNPDAVVGAALHRARGLVLTGQRGSDTASDATASQGLGRDLLRVRAIGGDHVDPADA